jgi:hypothetical protein
MALTSTGAPCAGAPGAGAPMRKRAEWRRLGLGPKGDIIDLQILFPMSVACKRILINPLFDIYASQKAFSSEDLIRYSAFR